MRATDLPVVYIGTAKTKLQFGMAVRKARDELHMMQVMQLLPVADGQ
jgi:hypothetical protein